MFYTDLRKKGVSIEHFRIMGLRSKDRKLKTNKSI